MRGVARGLGTGGALLAALACGGLPVGGEEVADEAVEPAPTEVVEAPPAEPEPAASPESLFEPLDAAEAPPTGAPACGDGLSIIRHPRANGLAVYCADVAGKKQGPLYLTKNGKVVELVEYADGVRSGRSVRWSAATPPVKLAEARFVADVQEGDAAEWDEAGNLVLRGKYAGGQKAGKFIESTAVEGGTPTFGGRCHDGGNEVWSTSDPAEFVSKACP